MTFQPCGLRQMHVVYCRVVCCLRELKEAGSGAEEETEGEWESTAAAETESTLQEIEEEIGSWDKYVSVIEYILCTCT